MATIDKLKTALYPHQVKALNAINAHLTKEELTPTQANTARLLACIDFATLTVDQLKVVVDGMCAAGKGGYNVVTIEADCDLTLLVDDISRTFEIAATLS